MIRSKLSSIVLLLTCIAFGQLAVTDAHAQKKAPPPTKDDLLREVGEIDTEITDEFYDSYREDGRPRLLLLVGLDARAFGGDADHREVLGVDTPLLFYDPSGATDALRKALERWLQEAQVTLDRQVAMDEAYKRRIAAVTADGGAQSAINMLLKRQRAKLVLFIEVRAIPEDLRHNPNQPVFKVFLELQDHRGSGGAMWSEHFEWDGSSDAKTVKFLAGKIMRSCMPGYVRRVRRGADDSLYEIAIQGLPEDVQTVIRRVIERREGTVGDVDYEFQREGQATMTFFEFYSKERLDDLLFDLDRQTSQDLGLRLRRQDLTMTTAQLEALPAEPANPEWLVYTKPGTEGHDDAIRKLKAAYNRKSSPRIGVLIDPDQGRAAFNVTELQTQLMTRFREAGLNIQRVPGNPQGDFTNLGFDILVLGESNPDAPDSGEYIFSVFDVETDRFIDAQVWPQEAAFKSRHHPINRGDSEGISRYVGGHLLASLAASFDEAATVDVVVHFTKDARQIRDFAMALEDSIASIERITNLRVQRNCASFSIQYQGAFLRLTDGIDRVADRFKINMANSDITMSRVDLVCLEPGQALEDVDIHEDHECGRRTLTGTPVADAPEESAPPSGGDQPDSTPPDNTDPPADVTPNPGRPEQPREVAPTPETPDRGDDDDRRRRRGERPAPAPRTGPVPATNGANEAIRTTYARLAASDPKIQSLSVAAADARNQAADEPRFDGILVLRKPKGNGQIGQQGLTFDKLKEAVMGEIEVVRGRKGGTDVLRSRAFQNELRQYQQDPTVQLAIPNYIFSTSDLPNTHLAQVQWAFVNKHNPGNTANWVNVADRIAAIRPSLVGVVDKGIHISDPRLQPALWVNKGEVPGNNKDDDGNGLIDDVHGFNFVSKTATLDWGRDADNHGSFCASQIAARQIGDTNDVISVAPNSSVITSVVLGADGAGEFSAILEGIGYAAANGARVINLSLGGQCDASALKALAESDFFKLLKRMNVVLVAAAGNENTNIDEVGYFPAGLPVENLITVAAIDADGMPGRGFRNGVWQQYTNYGVREVDMAAPGSQMLGVRSYGKTEMWDGTSMAAPMVTGTVALIQGMHPDWDYKTVIRAVTESVRPYDSLQGVVRTGGSLDIEAALDWTP